jgi:hypothetical protein
MTSHKGTQKHQHGTKRVSHVNKPSRRALACEDAPIQEESDEAPYQSKDAQKERSTKKSSYIKKKSRQSPSQGLICDEVIRNNTRVDREVTLITKAQELSIMTGARVLLMIQGPEGTDAEDLRILLNTTGAENTKDFVSGFRGDGDVLKLGSVDKYNIKVYKSVVNADIKKHEARSTQCSDMHKKAAQPVSPPLHPSPCESGSGEDRYQGAHKGRKRCVSDTHDSARAGKRSKNNMSSQGHDAFTKLPSSPAQGYAVTGGLLEEVLGASEPQHDTSAPHAEPAPGYKEDMKKPWFYNNTRRYQKKPKKTDPPAKQVKCAHKLNIKEKQLVTVSNNTILNCQGQQQVCLIDFRAGKDIMYVCMMCSALVCNFHASFYLLKGGKRDGYDVVCGSCSQKNETNLEAEVLRFMEMHPPYALADINHFGQGSYETMPFDPVAAPAYQTGHTVVNDIDLGDYLHPLDITGDNGESFNMPQLMYELFCGTHTPWDSDIAVTHAYGNVVNYLQGTRQEACPQSGGDGGHEFMSEPIKSESILDGINLSAYSIKKEPEEHAGASRGTGCAFPAKRNFPKLPSIHSIIPGMKRNTGPSFLRKLCSAQHK